MTNPQPASRFGAAKAGVPFGPRVSAAAAGPSKRNSGPQNGAQPAEERSHTEEGLLILSMDLEVLATDEQGVALLEMGQDIGEGRTEGSLPAEMRNALSAVAASRSTDRFFVRIAGRGYHFRAFVAQPRDGTRESQLVVHIRSDHNYYEAVAAVAAQYSLTDREQEVLRGIASGLASKEIAGRMGISPNTVKSFVRLMTGKMGVNSRSAIVGKLFGQEHPVPEPGDEN